ncbi:hypothetical protein YWIDRAFT_06071 [Streptomyces sp. SceaMP-e96]|uniref:hypothetical protein n=1 Tax=Streptomyces sp. SceaMP-e96 TaxID=1100824 RepID=UPI000823B64F|nr:hypothetical protein YWIDRAFT_06071 [Streptomyces sp. SceaMP-e96]
MPNRTFTWNEASARRLERSGLAGKPVAQDPAGIAAALCGAHAQVLSAAELSLMLRMDHGTRTAVQDALWCDRSLVKTYGPRGTVHLAAHRRAADVDRRAVGRTRRQQPLRPGRPAHARTDRAGARGDRGRAGRRSRSSR